VKEMQQAECRRNPGGRQDLSQHEQSSTDHTDAREEV